MGKLDYLIKQGWSKEEAEEYVRKLEEGRSPNEAYLAVREPSEVIDVEPVKIIEATESKPVKRAKSYKDEDISDYVQPNEGLGSLIKETYKEVKSIPGRKVREAVQDIRVGRVAHQRSREGQIKQRLFKAEQRGAEKEEIEHINKLARKEAERKLQFELRKARAKQNVSRRIKLAPITRPKPVRIANFYSPEGARLADPSGLFSLPQQLSMRQESMSNSMMQRKSNPLGTMEPNMTHMMNLLRPDGGSPQHVRKSKEKKGKHQKTFNYYYNRWE